jgi:DNA invertase Pin-like site-specific DNA recombinase
LRWVGYVRVSTDGQVDGYGLPAQRTALRSWERDHDGEQLTTIITEEGVSGDVADRPGLAAAFAIVSSRRAEGIALPRLDRLARDLLLQERLILELAAAGGRFRSAVAMEDQVLNGDPADPTRRFVRRVLGAAAELDRDMIAFRLRTGRAQKAAAGGYACGRPPYGWRAEKGSLVEVADEQIVIQGMRMFRKDGNSLEVIARAFSTPEKSWSRETVRAVLVRAGDIPTTAHERRKRARRAGRSVAA